MIGAQDGADGIGTVFRVVSWVLKTGKTTVRSVCDRAKPTAAYGLQNVSGAGVVPGENSEPGVGTRQGGYAYPPILWVPKSYKRCRTANIAECC